MSSSLEKTVPIVYFSFVDKISYAYQKKTKKMKKEKKKENDINLLQPNSWSL